MERYQSVTGTGLWLLIFSFLFTHTSGQTLLLAECLDEDLFSIFSGEINGLDARKFCSDRGGSLARISTLGEFGHVLSMASASSTSNFWIGVADLFHQGGPGASRFHYLDGSVENLDFIQTNDIGSFPWSEGEPNDFDSCGSFYGCTQPEYCVEWLSEENRWNDQSCDNKLGLICRSACPTRFPTTNPTSFPSVFQTPFPSSSQFPSAIPTGRPTEIQLASDGAWHGGSNVLPMFAATFGLVLSAFVAAILVLMRKMSRLRELENDFSFQIFRLD